MPKKSPERVAKKLAQSIYETDHASPGLLFWRAFFNWQGLIRTALEPYNLTQGQYAVLAALSFLSSDKASVSQQDIANQLAMDKMMVSDLVKSLLKKRFIIRKAHAEDSRAYALMPSPSGGKLLKKCVPIVESVDETFFHSTGDVYPAFHNALRILVLRQAK